MSQGVLFDENSQTRIYLLGRTLNQGDYVDRVHAEGELLSLVKELARTIERRADIEPIKVARCAHCLSIVPRQPGDEDSRRFIITTFYKRKKLT